MKKQALKITTITIILTVGLLAGLFSQALALLTVADLGLFELDRDAIAVTDDPNNGATLGDDWDLVYNTWQNLQPGGSGVILDHATARVFKSDIAGVLEDDIFQGGQSKDVNDLNLWGWQWGTPNDKSNITNAYAALYPYDADGDPTTENELVLYFGADRFANSGDAALSFWFFQQAITAMPPVGSTAGYFEGLHSEGDLLVQVEFTNGGAVTDVETYRWTNGALALVAEGQDCIASGGNPPAIDTCATVNIAPVPSPWPYTPKTGPAGTFPVASFVEGGVVLTDVLPDELYCYSSFMAVTRQSTSVNASLEDFTLGNFFTCRTDVTKTVEASFNRTYEWTIDKTVDPAAWDLFNGDSATSDYEVELDATYTDSDFAIEGTISFTNPLGVKVPVLEVTDTINGTTDVYPIEVTVTCNVAFPHIMDPGEVINCTYPLTSFNRDATENVATVHLVGGASDSVTEPIVWGEPTSTVNGSVTVYDNFDGGGDVQIGTADYLDILPVTISYDREFSCGSDKIYNDTASYVADDDATVTGSYSAAVDVDCHELSVTKTADESFTRTFSWTIDKQVTPAIWNLFDGDSGQSRYTVQVDADSVDSAYAVEGEITISNPAPIDAVINSVTDMVSPDIAANVNCSPATFPYTLPAGQNLVCDYDASLTSGILRTNTATTVRQNYAYDSAKVATAKQTTTNVTGSTGVSFAGVNPTLVHPSVDVEDSVAGTLGTVVYINVPIAFNYGLDPWVCPDDEGTYDNTATYVAEDDPAYTDNDSASVTVNCYALDVRKDAHTSLTRTYTWTIDKLVSPAMWDMFDGESAESDYTVSVSATPADSGWAVEGEITINNPAPMIARLNSVSDIVSPAIAATVDCGVAFPYSLTAGQKLECDYDAGLPDATTRTNTGAATLQNYDYLFDLTSTTGVTTDFTGTAAVTFAAPTITLVDESIVVSDAFDGGQPAPIGNATYTDTFPKTFNYPRTFTCGADDVYPNTASFVTNDTGATGSDSASVTVDCHKLAVTKDADTAYTRTYNWAITKTVNPASWVLFDGESGTSQYTVAVDQTDYDDSGFLVSGDIWVNNPAPIPATINSLTDVVSGAGNATVTCVGVTFPYTIPAAGTLHCTYTRTLTDNTQRLNTATANQKLSCYGGLVCAPELSKDYSGTADVIFNLNTPAIDVNKTIHVTDTNGQSWGPVGGDTTWNYEKKFVCADEGVNGNTATITETGQPASASVTVTCDALQVTKTASTTFTRTWNWTIDKTVVPASWDLFTGESGTSMWKVAVDKTGYTDSLWAAAGTITVVNPSTKAAEITGVGDIISPAIAANVNCGVTFPYMLAGGGTLNCTYSATLPDGTNRTNTATVDQQLYDYFWNKTPVKIMPVDDHLAPAFVTFAAPTTVVNATINVSDTNNQSFSATDDKFIEYPETFTCDEDEGDHVNKATITETGANDSATVNVACYALSVEKDVNATYTREHDWDILKSADTTALELKQGQVAMVGYAVQVNYDDFTDSDWAVNGVITVTNPAPMPAELVGVVDVVSVGINATVDCGAVLIVPAEGDLVCTYSTPLPDDTTRMNEATATQQLYDYDYMLKASKDGTQGYSGFAPVEFDLLHPTIELDECVDVYDDKGDPANEQFLGTVCLPDITETFTYNLEIGPYDDTACGLNEVTNIARTDEIDTGDSDPAPWTVTVNVICGAGCGYTQGYWKNHDWDSNHPDPTWYEWYTDGVTYPLLGGKALFFGTGKSWSETLDTPARAGNAYYILAYQYIAAYLNTQKMFDPAYHPDLYEYLGKAEYLLNKYGMPSPSIPAGDDWDEALRVAGWLDSFNNGYLALEGGPEHCESWMPNISTANLMVRTDQSNWTPVPISVKKGFEVDLDGSANTYFYLTIDLVTPPMPEGMYPFYLYETNAASFWSWWAAKGVFEGAPGTWEPLMWMIISAQKPIFYIDAVDTTGDDIADQYKLVDGLQYQLGQGKQYLRVNGDYPTGKYIFHGVKTIEMTFLP
jgi:hypothetical protein